MVSEYPFCSVVKSILIKTITHTSGILWQLKGNPTFGETEHFFSTAVCEDTNTKSQETENQIIDKHPLNSSLPFWFQWNHSWDKFGYESLLNENNRRLLSTAGFACVFFFNGTIHSTLAVEIVNKDSSRNLIVLDIIITLYILRN